MGFLANTYDFLDYDLFDLSYTIAHLKWLSLNYWYVVIALSLSLPIFLKSGLNFLKNNLNTKYFIFLFILFNFSIIFGFIDHIKYNFTFRTFLFALPVAIMASIFVFYNILFQKKKTFYAFFVLLILLNSYLLSAYNATEYGDYFYPYKLFAEKQPLIIDTKTPNLFFKNYVDTYNISDYSTFVVGPHDYFFVYYTNTSPSYLVRWKGSFIEGLSLIGTPIIWDPDDFVASLQKENRIGRSVFIITFATIYPIYNPLYKFTFDIDYAPEANTRISQILENDFKNFKIYTGKDNLSSVYYFPPGAKIES